jgi:uncharacterized membrane protein YhiD involved in acid resistance
MAEMFNQDFLGPTEIASYFSLWELLVGLLLSFSLCVFVGFIYRATHTGVSYSQSFVATTVIVGVTVTVIMLIIGSNIARAFTLVGALSIIRFRNAVKDTRDVGFIFLSMAIGMACGARFFGTAFIFTVVVSAFLYFLHTFDVFSKPMKNQILRLYAPEGVDHEVDFNELFFKFLESQNLLSLETVRQGMFLELVYSVVLRKDVSRREFIDALRDINGNAKVSLTQSETTNL